MTLLWNEDVNFEILRYLTNFINGVVHTEDGRGQKCYVTGVYGPLKALGRPIFWDQLKVLRQEEEWSWLVFKDFNEILFHSEKWGRRDRPEK